MTFVLAIILIVAGFGTVIYGPTSKSWPLPLALGFAISGTLVWIFGVMWWGQ